MSQTQNENSAVPPGEGSLNAAAAMVGALLWVMLSVLTGHSEAWDDDFYWEAGFPALLFLAFSFGWRAPGRPVRRGIWMGVGHALGALFSGLIHGSGFGLWPLMIGIMVVFTVILALMAALGGFFARRRQKQKQKAGN